MTEWPADQVERWPIERLIPYARNARTHTDEQVALIAASIREWGWTMPVLVDETGNLIAGHGRVLAARQLGLTSIPTMRARGWSDAQIRAYRLADNQLAQRAGWDDELLHLELTDLQGAGYDLDLIGFGERELAELLAERTEGLTDPDDVPPLPETPVSRPGDLWMLGRHRLLCGDATTADDVARVLAGVQPHLMVTDPPYGVEYDPDWRNRADRANGKPYGAIAVGTVNNDDRVDWRDAWTLFAGDVSYVWHGDKQLVSMAGQLAACGFESRNLIIWAKSRHIISRGHYHSQHESCWYAVRHGKAGHWHGDRSQTTLWNIDHLKSETGHSAQKPVECMRRPIANNSSPGQAVYDPFVGSGTTIIAAEITSRICHAIEIAPAYVDVAVKRWQDFTGENATRERDGAAFNDVAT